MNGSSGGSMTGSYATIPGYAYGSFKKCEKCSNKVEPHPRYTYVYECSECGFCKVASHVSFGIPLKVPNYYSLTKTHSAKNLFFNDGTSLESSIFSNKKINSHLKIPIKFSKIQKHWKRWIDENIVEMVRLSAIADHHNIGHNPLVAPELDPITYLLKDIKERQGIYLTMFGVDFPKNFKKKQKIGHAISYALRKSKILIWLGGSHAGHPVARILQSAGIRMYKPQAAFYGYKTFDKYKFIKKPGHWPEFLTALYESFFTPIYITGPSMQDCVNHGFTQETLDKYVYKFLTDLDNSLKNKSKLRVIINTGNTGVDTSVIRWAVKNNRHAIAINLKDSMYQNEKGYVSYDGNMSSKIDRLLKGITTI